MKRKLVLTAGLVLVVGGVVAPVLLSQGSDDGSGSGPGLPPATAEVTRTTLAETKTVSGTLGYGDPVPVAAAGQGTLTRLAPVASTVSRGEPLLKVDERPVVVLYGLVPMYRALLPGVTGADANQLEENLSALGYTGFTVDDDFTTATAAAVRDWQTDLGLALTGTVEPGQVIFTPGPVRVAEPTAQVGAIVGDGSEVLSYTSTTRLVTVELEVAEQALAVRGATVRVTIPGGSSVDGTITNIGTVAAAPPQASDESPPPNDSATADARIAVTVTIADQEALGTLDAAPVDVDLVSQTREDVLAVPVAALLALPEGGYGVEVVDGAMTRILPVRTGLFAAGRVEISGDGIEEGMKVGVPE